MFIAFIFFMCWRIGFYILMCLIKHLLWKDYLFGPSLVCCPCIRVSHRKQFQVSTRRWAGAGYLVPSSPLETLSIIPRGRHTETSPQSPRQSQCCTPPFSKRGNLIFQELAAAIKFALHPFSSWNIHQTNSNSAADHYLLLISAEPKSKTDSLQGFLSSGKTFRGRVSNGSNGKVLCISNSFSASRELQNFKLVN